MKRLFILLLAVGCEHATPDLTASEHRAKAEELTQHAQNERGKYDPTNLQPDVPPRSPFAVGIEHATAPYNPTEEYLANADRALRQAAAESQAAAKLEQSEDIACAAIPREQRSACPLIARQVQQVISTNDGIELVLRDDANTLDTVRRLQCHLSYARVSGFDRPSCPLFTRGLSIEMKGLHSVLFKGNSPEAAQRIQDQAWRVFKGAPEPVGVR